MARCRGIAVYLGAGKYIVRVCMQRVEAHRYRVEVVRYPVGEGKYMVEAVR